MSCPLSGIESENAATTARTKRKECTEEDRYRFSIHVQGREDVAVQLCDMGTARPKKVISDTVHYVTGAEMERCSPPVSSASVKQLQKSNSSDRKALQ